MPAQDTLGLPSNIRACLFDLDGVLTETAKLHAQAWQRMFDDFLRARSDTTGTPFVPFDVVRDFEQYVDGKPRADGTRAFLASRGIQLPEGNTSEPPSAQTIRGLGMRKNEILHELLRQEGVRAFPGALRYLRAVRDAGLKTAVVSSSRNGHDVLVAAGIVDRFDACIDGVDVAERHLSGKPSPDTYLAAAQALAVTPADAAVFEDAPAGVAAGSAGHFGFVVGIDRRGQADELRRLGADAVVSDLGDLLGAP